MSSTPRVSIIIPFLNAEKFIQEAIDSVLAQTYDDWELLLVDDGSTDTSTAISLLCAAQHAVKIRYIEHNGHQNRGACASRNLGVRNSKGEYIALLDADDVWLPYKLERQVAILDSRPEAALVYGATQYWHSWTGNPEDIGRDYVPDLGIESDTLVRPPALLTLSLESKAPTPCPSDILLRREIVERVGGFEESFHGVRQLYEDQAFLAKVYLEAPVFVASECWDKYRLHSDSCVSVAKRTRQKYAVGLFYLNWLENYLAEQGIKNIEIRKALRDKRWRYHHANLRDRHATLARLLGPVWHLVRQMKRLIKRMAWWILPVTVRHWLRAYWQGHEYYPPVGWVRFGSLRRIAPISRAFGKDRGLPIDRYYIEQFLAAQGPDIRGRVLEVGYDTYTRRFGGDRVTRSDVLHVMQGNAKATIVADLTSGDHIPPDTFDSIILTQTLQFVYDVEAAVKTLYRILKPGGILLATFGGISQISRWDMDRWGHYWNLTTLSAQRLFERSFPAEKVRVEAYGNVLAAIALLHGLAAQEFRQKELNYHDPDYEVLITVRAVKPEMAK
jgi:glycosyltransferase involved in cell wall biosynthesis